MSETRKSSLETAAEWVSIRNEARTFSGHVHRLLQNRQNNSTDDRKGRRRLIQSPSQLFIRSAGSTRHRRPLKKTPNPDPTQRLTDLKVKKPNIKHILLTDLQSTIFMNETGRTPSSGRPDLTQTQQPDVERCRSDEEPLNSTTTICSFDRFLKVFLSLLSGDYDFVILRQQSAPNLSPLSVLPFLSSGWEERLHDEMDLDRTGSTEARYRTNAMLPASWGCSEIQLCC